jgi:LDH2 family malate/lactate/ureidoglycolate dehydrogenase
MLVTNPIAVAVPAGKEPPFVADMATSAVANGKLEMLKRQNKEAPEGWIQDKNGSPATDPEELKQGGALLPLGSDPVHGSHKGYCLGAIVDIFSAVFSGANYGPWAPPFVSFLPVAPDLPGKGLGHFFGAMRIDAFRPAEEFKQHIDQWIRRFRQAETIADKDQLLIPGDPEREMETQRKKEGIPLLPAVVEDLEQLGKEFSIELYGY